MSDVVVCLHAAQGWDRAAQGVVGAGRELAAATSAKLRAVVLGTASEPLVNGLADRVDILQLTDGQGLDNADGERLLAALTVLCQNAGTVLLGSDVQSQELAPRLAHRLGGSSMADGVELIAAGDLLRVRRAAYGGRAAAVYELKRRPAVVWLRARSFAPAPARDETVELQRPVLNLAPKASVRVVERRVEKSDGVPLEEAALVVSGGRGLGGPEPFEDLKKLADVMGAAIGASRVACDEGWVPPSWQVGQTGKKVAPDLYLAIGISGAAQHLLGITDAKVVAAINTDPDAPILKQASFALIEDYKKAVPALIEKLAALRSDS